MKRYLYLILATLMIFGCNQSTTSEQKNATLDTTLKVKVTDPAALFTLPDAEKILGEQGRLTDSSTKLKADTFEFKNTYTANAKDPKTGKTGVIYFMFEKYSTVAATQNAYSNIKTGNEKHEGFKVLHDMGDEAYFHSDGENFYFILVRKAEKMFRMKVNKTTSTTSLNEFNLVAKNITDAL
jgi:hypothetical protein